MKKSIVTAIVLTTLSSASVLAATAEEQHAFNQLSSTVDNNKSQADKGIAEAKNRADNAWNNSQKAFDKTVKNSERIGQLEGAVGDVKGAAASAAKSAKDAAASATQAGETVKNLQGTVDTNTKNIGKNSGDIKNLQDDSALHEVAIIANSGEIGKNQAAIYDNKKGIETNAKAIVKTQKDAKDYTDSTAKQTLDSSYSYTNKQVGVEATARAEGDRQTLQAANSYTNQRFSDLGKRIDKVRKEASAGTASALAASQIPQVETTGRFALGAGVGGYNSEQAIAVGFSTRFGEQTITKFAVTTDTQHNVGFGAGIAVSW